MTALCSMDERGMREALDSELKKRAFWLNVYNAYGQLLLEQEPVDLLNGRARMAHYSARRICIAGRSLSLNDIEHGMLRGSRIWWSKGYLRNWFPSSFEKAYRVPLDPRIHFALNCGAASCPAIAFYTAENLDTELELAVSVFLEDDVEFNEPMNRISVTSLFNWYAGDFGGRKGIISFLQDHGSIPNNTNPDIVFKPYDWSTHLMNFNDRS